MNFKKSRRNEYTRERETENIMINVKVYDY